MQKTVCATAAAILFTATMAFGQSSQKKMPMPAKAMDGVSEKLMQMEQQMLTALQKKDFAGFKKYVLAGAWSVDENGYMPVDDFVKGAMDPKSNFMFESAKTSDMKVVTIDADAALVTYKL